MPEKYNIKIIVNGQEYNLTVVDTAGGDEYEELRTLFYRDVRMKSLMKFLYII